MKVNFKVLTCKHCNLDVSSFNTSLKANHIRWCASNPLRSTTSLALIKARNSALIKARNSITKEHIKARAEKIKKAHKEGKYLNASSKMVQTKIKNNTLKHTEETKKLIRKKALASNHRRLVRSLQKYTKKDGTVVLLESSWEFALAVRLDELNLEWSRPKPIKWIDECGESHNYFPDFYLPEFNLYLDPKNPQAIKSQQKKLKTLLTQYNNIIIIKTLEECKRFLPVAPILRTDSLMVKQRTHNSLSLGSIPSRFTIF